MFHPLAPSRSGDGSPPIFEDDDWSQHHVRVVWTEPPPFPDSSVASPGFSNHDHYQDDEDSTMMAAGAAGLRTTLSPLDRARVILGLPPADLEEAPANGGEAAAAAAAAALSGVPQPSEEPGGERVLSFTE